MIGWPAYSTRPACPNCNRSEVANHRHIQNSFLPETKNFSRNQKTPNLDLISQSLARVTHTLQHSRSQKILAVLITLLSNSKWITHSKGNWKLQEKVWWNQEKWHCESKFFSTKGVKIKHYWKKLLRKSIQSAQSHTPPFRKVRILRNAWPDLDEQWPRNDPLTEDAR